MITLYVGMSMLMFKTSGVSTNTETLMLNELSENREASTTANTDVFWGCWWYEPVTGMQPYPIVEHDSE